MEVSNTSGTPMHLDGAGVPLFFNAHRYRVLSAAGFTEKEVILYLLLLSGKNRREEGRWVLIADSDLESVSDEMGVSYRTVRRRLGVLRSAGAVQRTQAGSYGSVTAVLKPEPLVEELWYVPYVRESLEEKFPDIYGAAALEEEETQTIQEIMDAKSAFSRMSKRKQEGRPLYDVLDKAMEKTAKAKKFNEEKPDHQRMNGGKRRKSNAMPKDHTSKRLLERLRSRVKHNISVVQPKDTMENRSKMKALRKQYGAEMVIQVVDWVTEMPNWREVKRKCNLRDAGIPTPGILLGYAESIFPMALETKTETQAGMKEEDRISFD